MMQQVNIDNWIGVAAIMAFLIGMFIIYVWANMAGRWENYDD